MADANSTTTINALDTLESAAKVAQFVQGITLRVDQGGGVHLHSGEVSGLYYVMQNLIDRINKAKDLMSGSYHE